MFPRALSTTITPSTSFHCAGDPSFTETHSSRLFPSKSTIASEGGAVLVAPGVTTGGFGDQTSVSSGRPGLVVSDFAEERCAHAGKATTTEPERSSTARESWDRIISWGPRI